MYQLKLREFEGPFELLIESIENQRLSINQISLAEVADQYLNYLKEIQHFPMEEVASFIVVAATLMLVKSRTLMPLLHLSEEEEGEIQNLKDRLVLYNKYRSLAKQLEEIFGKNIIFGREPYSQIETVFIEPEGLTTAKIKMVLDSVLENLPKKEILPETLVKKTVTLEQKMDELIKRLQDKMTLCFSDINKPGCEKIELIMSFLALLELIKRGIMNARQNQAFGEIQIDNTK